MNIKSSLENILSYTKQNKITTYDYTPICNELDSLATGELQKDDDYGNHVAGK